ncbi:MAG: helix-turn-helix transcriptional regulator [Gammaproteobacteria bacterium]|nr:helix-turn-helix transcriptional regulator [Gammaproteobacteria bacterium]
MIHGKNVGNKTAGSGRSPCPVACSLDLLGDKWTLLVVRDLLLGKTTYTEFQNSPEGIPTNILAERLKRLQAVEIVEKASYQERPVRYAYHLTAKGRDLRPVLSAMIDWGNKYIPGTLSREQIAAMGLEKPGSDPGSS